MKTCQSCYHFHMCLCGDHGWCEKQEEHYELNAPADDCDYYTGEYEPPEHHYQSDYERDNPRDNIIEKEINWI